MNTFFLSIHRSINAYISIMLPPKRPHGSGQRLDFHTTVYTTVLCPTWSESRIPIVYKHLTVCFYFHKCYEMGTTRVRQLQHDSVLGFAVTSRTVVIENNSGLQWNRLLLITYSNRNIAHSKISDRNIVHSKILDRNIISRTA